MKNFNKLKTNNKDFGEALKILPNHGQIQFKKLLMPTLCIPLKLNGLHKLKMNIEE